MRSRSGVFIAFLMIWINTQTPRRVGKGEGGGGGMGGVGVV